MAERLTSQIIIQALIRQTQAQGGFATVLHKGDPISGAIIVQLRSPDGEIRSLERISDFAGGYQLMPIATEYSGDPEKMTLYLDRRCLSDPDLWIIELDVANAEQLVAAMVKEG